MPRTLADIFDETIEADLKWRESELALLKLTYQGAAEPAKTTILRALVCMLYAHYEGFCKFIFQEWAEVLTRRCVRINEFTPPYQLVALRPLVGGLPMIEDGARLVKAVEAAFKALEQRVTVESPLATSNLWIRVLIEATRTLSLEITAAQNYGREIDLLVSRRNEIAHGKTMAVKDLQSYQTYEDAAMSVMMDLALLLSKTLQDRTYLRSP